MKPVTQIACQIHHTKWYRCQCDRITLHFPWFCRRILARL